MIHTDASKDHDGEGKDFTPTDLLAFSLGTFAITIMGIEEKRRRWELGNIKIDVYKIMTKDGLRKIKNLTLEIYLRSAMDFEKYKILRKIAEDFPIKRILENSIEINSNLHQTKIEK